MLDKWTSRFAAATANAAESIRLAEDTGQPNFAAMGRAVLAWLHAVQGRPQRTAELAELALAHSVEHERRVRPSRRGRWGWPSSLPVARRPR